MSKETAFTKNFKNYLKGNKHDNNIKNKEFVISMVDDRDKIRDIIENASTFSQNKWEELYRESYSSLALRKTIIASKFVPYYLIQDVCANINHPLNKQCIPELFRNKLEEKELEICANNRPREIKELFKKKQEHGDKIIINQSNINSLASAHYNSYKGYHLRFVDDLDVIKHITDEFYRLKNISDAKDEIMPYNFVSEALPHFIEFLHNPYIPAYQKREMVSDFPVDFVEIKFNIPEGLEDLAYQVCSMSFFENSCNNPDPNIQKTRRQCCSVLRYLIDQGRFSESIEIDFINNVETLPSLDTERRLLQEILFENMRTEAGVDYFVNIVCSENNFDFVSYFSQNQKLDKQMFIKALKEFRNKIDLQNSLYEKADGLQNKVKCKNRITFLEETSARILSSVNLYYDENISDDDKQFLLSEYKKISNSKFTEGVLADKYFSRSPFTPDKILTDTPICAELLPAQVNLTLRNKGVKNEAIEAVLEYSDDIFGTFVNHMLPIPYIDCVNVLDALNELIIQKSTVSEKENLQKQALAQNELIDLRNTVLSLREKSYFALCENIKQIFTSDTLLTDLTPFIKPNFEEVMSTKELAEELDKMPLNNLKNELETILFIFGSINEDPITANKYIDAFESFYELISNHIELSKSIPYKVIDEYEIEK